MMAVWLIAACLLFPLDANIHDHLDLIDANDVILNEHPPKPPEDDDLNDNQQRNEDEPINHEDPPNPHLDEEPHEDDHLNDDRQEDMDDLKHLLDPLPIKVQPDSKVNDQSERNHLPPPDRPLITNKMKQSQTSRKSQKSYAWVSMVDSDVTSVISARVLAQSLTKHGSTADKVLICVPGASDTALAMLRRFGWKTRTIDVNTFEKITHFPRSVQRELFKILLFNLTEYDSVGYLSAESMVTTDIDHLFQCGEEALCGTPDDRHHEMYHHNQRQTRSVLRRGRRRRRRLADSDDEENVDYILYDERGRMKRPRNGKAMAFGVGPEHDAVFDDNIFVVAPEHDLYRDLFAFMTASHDEMALRHDGSPPGDFPSYLSEYFYHYCKGSGHPISRQRGPYSPPRVTFECTSSRSGGSDNDDRPRRPQRRSRGNEVECKMEKEISKSPCYVLENGYNFHPSHNDHISASWHWQSAMDHVHIKIIQFSSDRSGGAHARYKPWKWRLAALSGWMMEWNAFAERSPNLYFEFLLHGDAANEELIYMLWHTPTLYLFFIVILLSAFTAVSAPCCALCAVLMDSVAAQWPSLMRSVIAMHRVVICPVVTLCTLYLIVRPIQRVFVDLDVIPEAYPLRKGCLLSLQYCYLTACYQFVAMCFVLYWLGALYHPKRCRLQWPRYLQLSLFAFDPSVCRSILYRSAPNQAPTPRLSPNQLTSVRIDSASPYSPTMTMSHSTSSSVRRKYSERGGDGKVSGFAELILRVHRWRFHVVHDVVLRYCSILVVIAVKWCLWYMACIVMLLSTIWILRWNDWHELRVIIGVECVVAVVWLTYCSLATGCQFFIYPQLRKFGERYYDLGTFAKGQ